MSDDVWYQLRPGIHQPAFRLDELYRFLGETVPPGYIWLELAGQRRCVWSGHFERVQGGTPGPGADPGGG